MQRNQKLRRQIAVRCAVRVHVRLTPHGRIWYRSTNEPPLPFLGKILPKPDHLINGALLVYVFLNMIKIQYAPSHFETQIQKYRLVHCQILKCHHFHKNQLQYQYVRIRYDSVPYHVLYVPILNYTILYHAYSMPYNTVRTVIQSLYLLRYFFHS